MIAAQGASGRRSLREVGLHCRRPGAKAVDDAEWMVRRFTTDGQRRALGSALAVVLAAGLAACADRVRAEEVEEIARLLELAPGKTVADVGAGDGKWAVELARRVGEEGRIYATEITEKLVGEIEERIRDEGLGNVEAILGDQERLGLPEACCDAILLRMVYHHFEQPGPMRAGIRRALRPEGLLAVIDIVPQKNWRELPEVPDRGGHGIAPEDLVAELTADGFEAVSRHDDWNGDPERYCVVFRLAHDP